MTIRVWDGSIWKPATRIKVWDGSSWVRSYTTKIWNGSSWVIGAQHLLDFRAVYPGYTAAPKGGVAYYGYSSSGGTISPGASDWLTFTTPSYSTILNLEGSENVGSQSILKFYLNDAGNHNNAGFGSITVANTTSSFTLNRTAASFANSSSGSSSVTAWEWTTGTQNGDMWSAAYYSGQPVTVTWNFSAV